jgi:hypothetical protein
MSNEVRPSSSLVHLIFLMDDSIALTIDSRRPEPAVTTLVDLVPEPGNVGVCQFG